MSIEAGTVSTHKDTAERPFEKRAAVLAAVKAFESSITPQQRDDLALVGKLYRSKVASGRNARGEEEATTEFRYNPDAAKLIQAANGGCVPSRVLAASRVNVAAMTGVKK